MAYSVLGQSKPASFHYQIKLFCVLKSTYRIILLALLSMWRDRCRLPSLRIPSRKEFKVGLSWLRFSIGRHPDLPSSSKITIRLVELPLMLKLSTSWMMSDLSLTLLPRWRKAVTWSKMNTCRVWRGSNGYKYSSRHENRYRPIQTDARVPIFHQQHSKAA